MCYTGVNCSTAGNQQVSNQSSDEFILFQFSKPVDPSSINLQSLTGSDMDVSYWLGGTSGQNLSLTNKSADLTGGTPTGSVNAILFGASYASNSGYNDSFLIGSMSGIANPEPSSIILLFTITLFVFGISRRARRKPQQVSD